MRGDATEKQSFLDLVANGLGICGAIVGFMVVGFLLFFLFILMFAGGD